MRSRSHVLFGLAFALLPGAIMTVASCGDETSNADPEADARADARRRDGSSEEELDAEADADAFVKPVNIPACVGASIPMPVSGVRAFVEIPLGSLPDGGYSAKGPWVIDFGSIGSTIDMHAFGDAGPPSATFCGADASAPGINCTFQGFDFFGDWGQVYLRTADHSTLFGGVRQAGILATDFLMHNPFALDFTRQKLHRNDVGAFCTDAQLLGAGFRPIPTGGFYSSDLSKLRPLSEVLDKPDATAGFTVPNVPTVPITIAGFSALAQLDTGYEDRLSRRSMNVNEALFAQLNAQPGLLQRYVDLDLFVTTCVPGLSERLEGYLLPPGATVDFIGEGGAIARSDEATAVYLKHTKDETFSCGGISTWTVPAAQVGASFFIDAQALIVDPTASRVWLPAK
jgi:hypothetical protein